MPPELVDLALIELFHCRPSELDGESYMRCVELLLFRNAREFARESRMTPTR